MSSPLLLAENEHEAIATLQDALAFIDAFEAETLATVGGAAPSGDAIKKRPSSRNIGKKRSHTERVKCELERLRTDAEALEATLKRLKQEAADGKPLTVRWTPPQLDLSSSSLRWTGGDKGPRVAKWMEIVMEEYRRRRESEALNRRLRVMLSKQFNMAQASEAALSFRFTNADFDALYGPEIRVDVSQEKALVRSLSTRVRQLQLDVDSVLKRTGLIHVDSYLSWSQRKHDASMGVFFESTLCLPICFSLEQTVKEFSGQICKTSTNGEMKDLFDACQHQETKVEYQQQTFDLTIKASLRTLLEENRVIYVWSAQAALPGKHWTFLEDSIIVVRRAGTQTPTSLVQNWHRVWMEEEGSQIASDPLKESILSSLSKRGKDHLRTFKASMESTKGRESAK